MLYNVHGPSLRFLHHIVIDGLILLLLDSFLTPQNPREMLGVRQRNIEFQLPEAVQDQWVDHNLHTVETIRITKPT